MDNVIRGTTLFVGQRYWWWWDNVIGGTTLLVGQGYWWDNYLEIVGCKEHVQSLMIAIQLVCDKIRLRAGGGGGGKKKTVGGGGGAVGGGVSFVESLASGRKGNRVSIFFFFCPGGPLIFVIPWVIIRSTVEDT